MRQRGKIKTVKHKTSDLPFDDMTEEEKEAWREWERQLDDYIEQYSAALRKHLEEIKRRGGGRRARPKASC